MDNVRALRPTEPAVTPVPVQNRREQVVAMLAAATTRGMTWREVAAATGVGHGSVSAVLSTLHAEGVVARLREKRDDVKVYVLREWVNGRDVESPRRTRRTVLIDDMAAVLKRVPTKCQHYYEDVNCRSCEIKRLLRMYEERRQ